MADRASARSSCRCVLRQDVADVLAELSGKALLLIPALLAMSPPSAPGSRLADRLSSNLDGLRTALCERMGIDTGPTRMAMFVRSQAGLVCAALVLLTAWGLPMTWARSSVVFGVSGPYGGPAVRWTTYYIGEAHSAWRGVVFEEMVERFAGIGGPTGPWLPGVILAAAPALAGVLALVGCAMPRKLSYHVAAFAFTYGWVAVILLTLVDSLPMLSRESPRVALPALAVSVIAWALWVLRFAPANRRAWPPVLWVSLWGKTTGLYVAWVGILALHQRSPLSITLCLTALGGALMLRKAGHVPLRLRKAAG